MADWMKPSPQGDPSIAPSPLATRADDADSFENAPAGYMLLNADGHIDRINRAGAALLGWEANWLRGKRFERWVLEADRPLLAAHWRRCTHHPKGDNEELRVKSRQGRIVTVRLDSAAERHENGEPAGCRCLMIDVSGEQRSARKLRQLQAQLAHVARLNTVGEMAAGLAHELNQPLGTVVLNCETALRLLAAGKAADYEFVEVLGHARDAAAFASEVVRHLRGFLRQGNDTRSACELRDLLRDVATLIRADARDNDMELGLEIAPRLPTMCVDAVQIEQVLLNLAHNSIEAMRETREESGKVTIAVRELGAGDIQFSVTDTGPGMDARQLSRAFAPFFTTKCGGMGMGLSISRSIVETHGGRLWAESEPGRGTSVHFVLPPASDTDRADPA